MHELFFRVLAITKGSQPVARSWFFKKDWAFHIRAAHCLYMAELERVKRDKMMYKAFASLEKSTKKTLEMAFLSISNIDGTETSIKEQEES